jgi:hypothetical protein
MQIRSVGIDLGRISFIQRLPSLDSFPGICSGNEKSAGVQGCDCRQLSTDANRAKHPLNLRWRGPVSGC